MVLLKSVVLFLKTRDNPVGQEGPTKEFTGGWEASPHCFLPSEVLVQLYLPPGVASC